VSREEQEAAWERVQARDAVYQVMSTVELRARVADGDWYCAKGELQRLRAPLCTFRRAFPF
jgi:hypothetical protein